MKNIITLFLLLFGISLFAQSEIKITQKKCVPKKGIHIRLINVFDDSRCPENVTCIWAGEVTIAIEVYLDRNLIEEKTMVINSKNQEENCSWFAKYYSEKIMGINVLPYPNDGKSIKSKEYYLILKR